MELCALRAILLNAARPPGPWLPQVLLCLLVTVGCNSMSNPFARRDDSFSYDSMRQQIQGPDPSSYRSSFERTAVRRQGEGLLDNAAPSKWSKNLKRATGQGPKPEEARKIYAQAERQYEEAMELEGSARRRRFETAAKGFAEAAKKWPDSALEQDALFLSGEAYFFADRFPAANKQFEQMIKKYPNSAYLDLVEARRFSVAQYWLQISEKRKENLLSTNVWDRRRPWRDSRGEALRIFDRIRIDDPTGRLADDATMAAGNAHFRRGQFIRADEFYSDLRTTFPTSEHQFMAHFLGVQAKLEAYQGPDYSGVVLDDAEKLLQQIRRQFPGESEEHREHLTRMQHQVRYLLAEREWSTAKYYEKQKAFAAARFYYDIIEEDFDDTPFAERAQQRSEEIAHLAPRPPQYFEWLVNVFPATTDQRPLMVSRPLGPMTR
jgi:outer membrane protein assembly factor BamD (BamD/ComL family)